MILLLGSQEPEHWPADWPAPVTVMDADSLLRCCLERHVSQVVLPEEAQTYCPELLAQLRLLGVPHRCGLPAVTSKPVSGGTPLVLDGIRMEVQWREHRVRLTEVEWRLLLTLYQTSGVIFSRETLSGVLYRDHRVVEPRTVDSHIKRLRKKLRQLQLADEPVETVYGQGYRYRALAS